MLSFPRAFSREIRPFFRLLEDPFFDSPSSLSTSQTSNQSPYNLLRSSTNQLTSFTPSFDVRETKDAYVLDGELPGITDKSELDLQFVDGQTLVVKGRIERSTSNHNESGEGESVRDSATAAEKPHKPTVEDATEEEGSTSSPSESAVTKTNNNQAVSAQNNNNGHRFWIQERMVGEFQRSFSFPQGIDQDAVKASLKNGILSIVVPKRNVADTPRRIQIE